MVAELVRPKTTEEAVGAVVQGVSPAAAPGARPYEAWGHPRSDDRAMPNRRFFLLNAAFALLLLGEAITEAAVYGAPENMAVSAPFVVLFAFYALRLKPAPPVDRAHYLRWSGWSAVALSVMCFIATIGAATATPVDVACIIMSTIVGTPLALGGLAQLRAAGK